MLKPSHARIAIIGGGPGGSSAASLLRMQGHEVALFEMARFPRPMVGESLIPHFWKFIDAIGLTDQIENEGFIIKNGGIVSWAGNLRSVKLSDFGFTRPALHIERDRFDTILMDRAKDLGTQVFENCKVTKVEFGTPSILHWKDLITGETGETSCDFLIDSSGQNAVVSRQENLRVIDDDFKFQSFWGYYRQSNYFDVEGNVHPFENRYTTHPSTYVSELSNWGWSWHIMQRDQVSIGYILPKEMLKEFRNGGDSMDDRFKALKRFNPILNDWLKDEHFIPGSVGAIKDYAYEPIDLAHNNCYLVGDAAAFVDPLNSNGVVMALFSAYLAAWCIDKSIESTDRIDFYKGVYEKKLRERLALFKMIAVPHDTLTEEQLAIGKKMFAELDDTEVYLILTQTNLTERAKNLDILLGERNLKFKQMWKDLSPHTVG